jgi:hypothetical protein
VINAASSSTNATNEAISSGLATRPVGSGAGPLRSPAAAARPAGPVATGGRRPRLLLRAERDRGLRLPARAPPPFGARGSGEASRRAGTHSRLICVRRAPLERVRAAAGPALGLCVWQGAGPQPSCPGRRRTHVRWSAIAVLAMGIAVLASCGSSAGYHQTVPGTFVRAGGPPQARRSRPGPARTAGSPCRCRPAPTA